MTAPQKTGEKRHARSRQLWQHVEVVAGNAVRHTSRVSEMIAEQQYSWSPGPVRQYVSAHRLTFCRVVGGPQMMFHPYERQQGMSGQ
jgi:hypothetical protein